MHVHEGDATWYTFYEEGNAPLLGLSDTQIEFWWVTLKLNITFICLQENYVRFQLLLWMATYAALHLKHDLMQLFPKNIQTPSSLSILLYRSWSINPVIYHIDGILVSLRKRENWPPLPSILLTNVQSLDNKVDELRSRMPFKQDTKNCNVMVFTRTWLDPFDPWLGYCHRRTLRSPRRSLLHGKQTSWCSDVKINSCSPNLEHLMIGYRGSLHRCIFHQPRPGRAVRSYVRTETSQSEVFTTPTWAKSSREITNVSAVLLVVETHSTMFTILCSMHIRPSLAPL